MAEKSNPAEKEKAKSPSEHLADAQALAKALDRPNADEITKAVVALTAVVSHLAK